MSISCVICNYAITEPLCANCVVNEVRTWVYDSIIKQKTSKIINKKLGILLDIIASLNYVTSPFEEKDGSAIKCIKCKNELPLMCFYCVSNKASQVVKSNVKNKQLVENFEESFNINI